MVFHTLNGDFEAPPFHIHCRSIVRPWQPGHVSDARKRANEELQRRPLKERRIGPDGEIGGSVPPPDRGNPPSGPKPLSPAQESRNARVVETKKKLDDLIAKAQAKPKSELEKLVERNQARSVAREAAQAKNAAMQAAGGARGELAKFVSGWTGANAKKIEMMNRALLRGEYPEVQKLLRTGGTKAPVLYRVMDMAAADIKALVAGADLDLGKVASFTSSREYIDEFASFATKTKSRSLIIRLEDGVGLSIKEFSNTPWEMEWLLSGKIRIVSKKKVGGITEVTAKWLKPPAGR